MVSGFHCVWRAASAFQDCKGRISSLIGGALGARKDLKAFAGKGRWMNERAESSADFFLVP